MWRIQFWTFRIQLMCQWQSHLPRSVCALDISHNSHFCPPPLLSALFPLHGKRSFASVFLCFNLSQSPHLSNLLPFNPFMWIWPDRQGERTPYRRCFWSKAAILLPSNICSKSESKFYSHLLHWWLDALCCCAGFRLMSKEGCGLIDCYFIYWAFTNKKKELHRGKLNDLYCWPNFIWKMK